MNIHQHLRLKHVIGKSSTYHFVIVPTLAVEYGFRVAIVLKSVFTDTVVRTEGVHTLLVSKVTASV